MGIYTVFAEGGKNFEKMGIYTGIYTSDPLYLPKYPAFLRYGYLGHPVATYGASIRSVDAL